MPCVITLSSSGPPSLVSLSNVRAALTVCHLLLYPQHPYHISFNNCGLPFRERDSNCAISLPSLSPRRGGETRLAALLSMGWWKAEAVAMTCRAPGPLTLSFSKAGTTFVSHAIVPERPFSKGGAGRDVQYQTRLGLSQVPRTHVLLSSDDRPYHIPEAQEKEERGTNSGRAYRTARLGSPTTVHLGQWFRILATQTHVKSAKFLVGNL